MVYIREFEIYEAEGYYLSDPCDMPGGTFGDSFADAIESAVDWLRDTVMDDLAHGRETVGGVLGNGPRHDGRIVVIAVECDLRYADAVSAAEAARILGVSSARVSQMCEKGLLVSFKSGSSRLVMRDSIKARLEEKPRPGRPRKHDREALSA